MDHPNQAAALDAPPGLSKRDFRKRYSQGARLCLAGAGFGYFSVVATLVMAFTGIMGGSLLNLLDAGIVLTLTLLIHLVKSRIAAVVFLAFSLFNVAVYLISQGTFAGYLNVIGGILAVIGAFQCAKEWREYQVRTGAAVESAADRR
ncbi:MAG: hypothetical protein GX417_10635 [Clostridiales bacterium]|nr:hypothetical protein [Clostridiales bacterium]